MSLYGRSLTVRAEVVFERKPNVRFRPIADIGSPCELGLMDWIGPAPRALDELAAFDAMRAFLEAYWERGGKRSDDLAALLGSLNRDVLTNSQPLDVALWQDWREAVDRAKASAR